MNPHTKAAMQGKAQEMIRKANQLFGCQEALRITLELLGCDDVKGLVDLAKSRRLEEFETRLTAEHWPSVDKTVDA